MLYFSGVDTNIIQIAAFELNTGCTFESYVFPPSGFIPKAVTKLTNIEIHASNMFFKSKQVPSTDTRTALTSFTAYLAQFGKSVLLAHNVLFDSKILINSCIKYGVEMTSVEGFGDTLALFKREYPDRKQNGKSYKQSDLVKDIVGIEYVAHSAVEDVIALSKLLQKVDNFEEKLLHILLITLRLG
jgi:DNA polymerase III alpha subunit (gram-positive type)